MINAGLDNKKRKAIYARDGYRCALCDSTQYIQIHHVVHRSKGGSNHEHNLITLCSTCHGHVHGIIPDYAKETSAEDMMHYCVEYLADYYAPDWNPWRKDCEPWREAP